MNRQEERGEIAKLLSAFKAGEINLEAAQQALEKLRPVIPPIPPAPEELLLTEAFKLDLNRAQRTGVEEVIFGLRKTKAQVKAQVAALLRRGVRRVLITKTEEAVWQEVAALAPGWFHYHSAAKLIYPSPTEAAPAKLKKVVGVLTAGSSDVPVAEEACLSLQFLGMEAQRFYDVGVAGLGRLASVLEELRRLKILIVVAGMEGALPSVVAGLVKSLVIAVPTSVGYGAHFGGVAALLAMLGSCAPGIVTVNIDNGFGAAAACAKLLTG